MSRFGNILLAVGACWAVLGITQWLAQQSCWVALLLAALFGGVGLFLVMVAEWTDQVLDELNNDE